ncbi:hypothetical protein QAD02_023019 [Eretmocerus hayati]|uniref:Uncharacterized protein n=1 Tax=Eretmocerus hayati TaxID=131215 RepID=A0ACC2PZJ2_9HYME|nr:hypothetical protein QAD02_023019 [Eretmocerus hayati]
MEAADSACPTPRLKNGRIRARNRGRTIRYSCSLGYELVGNKYSTCKRGSWDTPTPICVSPRCSPMPTPKHAVVGAKYRGAILMYFCEPGFVLVGNAEIYCDGLQWNGSAPSCRDSNALAPTSCDFEQDDLCWWEQDPRHDFDWTRHRFDTPSSHIGTGPTHDHTLGPGYDGYYLYIEASGRLVNDTARIISPLYSANLTESGCFSFWYHMYGTTIGSLNVYFKPESANNSTLLWSKQGDQGNQWLRGLINLPTVNNSFQIIIEGVRGSQYVSDIAIDDLAILQGDECIIHTPPTTEPSENDEVGMDEVERVNAMQSCRDRCVDTLETTMVPEFWPYPDICQCTIDCADTGSCCPDYAEFCIYEITDPVETVVPSSSTMSSPNTPVSTSATPSTEVSTQSTTIASTSSTTAETPTTRATIKTTKPSTKIDAITSTIVSSTTPKITIRTTEKPRTSKKVFYTTSTTTVRTTTNAITTKNVDTPFFVPLSRTSASSKEIRAQADDPQIPVQVARQSKVIATSSVSKIIVISTGATLLIALATIAALSVVRRRNVWDRSYKGSGFSEDSDVRFLTSDEHLDFSIAKPSRESEKV